MHVANRALEAIETFADQILASDRLAVTGDQNLRLEIADERERGEVCVGEAVLVTPDRVEIREVGEERAKQVAREEGVLMCKPDHAAVDRLAPRGREQYEASAANFELEAILEGQVGDRRVLHHGLGMLLRNPERLVDHVGEPDIALRLTAFGNALVVGLARGILGLRHEERPKVPK